MRLARASAVGALALLVAVGCGGEQGVIPESYDSGIIVEGENDVPPLPVEPEPEAVAVNVAVEEPTLVAAQSWPDQYRDAIEEVFPEAEWGRAWQVAHCETGGTFAPHAVGDGGLARGAFQVHARFWGPVPQSVRGQVEQAYGIWQRSGWWPWTCARLLGFA